MADLSSWDAFRKSASWSFGDAIASLIASTRLKRISLTTYSLGADTFTAGTDRYAAGGYALYRRRCRNKGIEPGPYS